MKCSKCNYNNNKAIDLVNKDIIKYIILYENNFTTLTYKYIN